MKLKYLEKLKKRKRKFEKKLTPQQKKMWSLLVFLIKFGILSLPVYFIMFSDLDFFILQDIEANQVNTIVNLLGTNSSVQYCGISECSPNPPGMPSIVYQDKAIGIDRACTGYRSFFALLALMLAVSGIENRKRTKGFVFAIIIVYLANILRLVTTFYLSQIFDFELIHGIMWREGMIAVVFFSWLFWLKKL